MLVTTFFFDVLLCQTVCGQQQRTADGKLVKDSQNILFDGTTG